MPMGEYKNFADCVAQNSDKENPEAYCGRIRQKVEGEDINVINEVLVRLGEPDSDGVIRGLQLMPLGTWNHPMGEIAITPQRARRFAEQFKKNVAGQELPVYYIHSEKTNLANPQYGKAAGWIQDVRDDDQLGVVVDIKFTPDGLEAVKKKEYAYLSAEYFDQVQLPHHTAPEQDVIVGAALVNRPHLKGMNPILNEETGHQFLLGLADNPIKGGNPMDPILRQLCEQAQISLSEDQTELTEDQRTELNEFLASEKKKLDDATTKINLLEDQIEETDPEKAKAKSLEEAGFSEEAKLLSEYRADRMVTQLEEFVPEGRQLSPAAKKVIREYALEQTQENLTAMHKVLLSDGGTVDLRELGSSGGGENEEKDDSGHALANKILTESQKVADEKKISLAEAMDEYSRSHPDEWNQYQESLGARAARMGG